jgi:hypothetical protein
VLYNPNVCGLAVKERRLLASSRRACVEANAGCGSALAASREANTGNRLRQRRVLRFSILCVRQQAGYAVLWEHVRRNASARRQRGVVEIVDSHSPTMYGAIAACSAFIVGLYAKSGAVESMVLAQIDPTRGVGPAGSLASNSWT